MSGTPHPSAPAYPSGRKPEGWQAPVDAWGPDVLGEGFAARTLELEPLPASVAGFAAQPEENAGDTGTGDDRARDAAGMPEAGERGEPGDPGERTIPQVATLVRHEGAPAPRFVVLHLHGWNDYFFHWEVARMVADLGGVMYGLDLRGYGRSLRPGVLPGYVDDLARYTEEIDAAWGIIGAEVPDAPRILSGHSTGGLVASLWAADHPGALAGLALNSPWLESIPLRGLARLTASALRVLARGEPTRRLPLPEDTRYVRSLGGTAPGEDTDRGVRSGDEDAADPFHRGWDLEPTWRLETAPVYAGWIGAVLRSQARVADGFDIDCPVLVLTAARSSLGLGTTLRAAVDDVLHPAARPEPIAADIVLDVTAMRRRALDLGPRVALVSVEGAIHDVMASAPGPRRAAQREFARWLDAVLTPPGR